MTSIARPFVVSESDKYAYNVSQPLRTSDSRPIDTQEQVANVNKETFDKLANYHQRSAADGYFQSHPFSQMFTSYDLATDEATLNNNYMRLIFGGKEDPNKDEINGAYKHAIKQRAEAAVTKENTLEELNPSDFVSVANVNKDSLLQTFAEGRRFFKGQIDTDAERAMKGRVSHEMIETTFYGKNVSEAGAPGRFHHLAGQHGHLQYRMDPAKTLSWWNLSSRNYAPDGEGGQVPLIIQNEIGDDQRSIPLTGELRTVAPEPSNSFNLNDIGLYPGKDIDNYVTSRVENNPTFEQLFQDSKQRRWV